MVPPDERLSTGDTRKSCKCNLCSLLLSSLAPTNPCWRRHILFIQPHFLPTKCCNTIRRKRPSLCGVWSLIQMWYMPTHSICSTDEREQYGADRQAFQSHSCQDLPNTSPGPEPFRHARATREPATLHEDMPPDLWAGGAVDNTTNSRASFGGNFSRQGVESSTRWRVGIQFV